MCLICSYIIILSLIVRRVCNIFHNTNNWKHISSRYIDVQYISNDVYNHHVFLKLINYILYLFYNIYRSIYL